jgi:hypothetical protein
MREDDGGVSLGSALLVLGIPSTMLAKLLRISGFVLLLPLLLAVAVLAMPLVLLLQGYEFLRLRWYCWSSGCWTYLVCSPRRAWNEFLENNVLAALPEGVGVAWTSGQHAAAKPLQRLFGAGTGKGKPYFAHVGMLSTTVYPLHQLLQPLKAIARRDAETQEFLRGLLERELRNFLSSA